VPSELTPDNTVFVSLSFEGPDQYSQAGGLGVRVAGLTTALAAHGFETHLLFIGDPYLPAHESREQGRLTLHRWCQWISRFHPAGVYDGEEGKLGNFNDSAPWFLADRVLAPALHEGKIGVVIAEDWQTAEAICRLSDLLFGMGLRDRAVLMWNANNLFGFHRINWGRLSFVSTITTVSKYMKHRMWAYGQNPLVVPNGIPERFLEAPPSEYVEACRALFADRMTLFKIGRFDPDKRWLMAVEAVACLRAMGVPVRLLVRGGVEPHGGEVLQRAHALGLWVHDVGSAGRTMDDCLAAFRAAPPADVLNLTFFLPEDFVRTLYRASDAVLANSGHEPFGLVGLEVMGAGGTAVTGSTGEDYAVHFENAVVVDTEDPSELAGYLVYLRDHPEQVERLRAGAAATARQFTWSAVLPNLLGKASYLAERQGAL
jgi:glycosyltransferase involved in cell wall biosynthesis